MTPENANYSGDEIPTENMVNSDVEINRRESKM